MRKPILRGTAVWRPAALCILAVLTVLTVLTACDGMLNPEEAAQPQPGSPPSASADTRPPGWAAEPAQDPLMGDYSSAGFSFILDEDGRIYWLLVPAGSAAPDAESVFAGRLSGADRAAASGSTAAEKGAQVSILVGELSQRTAYDAYFAAEDALGNRQGDPEIRAVSVTTPGRPAPAAITSFSACAQADARWIGITVMDKAAVSDDTSIHYVYGDSDTSIVPRLLGLEEWNALTDGGEVRIPLAADESYSFSYGAIYLAEGDLIIDYVAFTTGRNEENVWLTGDAALGEERAAAEGAWLGTGVDSAFNAGSPEAGDYASRINGVRDGGESADWERRRLCLKGVGVSPERAVNDSEAAIRVSVTAEEENAASSGWADLSGLGGDAETPLVRTESGFCADFTVPAGLAAGEYTVPVRVSGAGIERSAEAVFTAADPDPEVTVESVFLDYEAALCGQTVTLTAHTAGKNGASVTGVFADLSAFGLGDSVPLTGEGSGIWTYQLTVPDALDGGPTGGRWDIPVTAEDTARGIRHTGIAEGVLEAGSSVSAFSGGNCESPIEGADEAFEPSGGEAYEGGSSLRFETSVGSNQTLNFSGGSIRRLPENPRFLTFRFKGSVSGEAPGLRVQVGAGGGLRNYFDLNGLVSGQDYEPPCVTGISYSKAPISADQWTYVKLDLASVVWDDPKTDAAEGTGPGDYPILFRVRSPSAHRWYIDDVRFTNE